jgi:NAD(P)-dependent dehydrogenase (short-subunit alcohol dehydrogenase family)
MKMVLEHKNAVIYGGGGVVGGAVARAFAAEGARVFLAGRTPAKLEAVAADIAAAGGAAETAQVDALDPGEVEAHAAAVTREAGSLDISLNAIGQDLSDFGIPLADLTPEAFARPIEVWTRTLFITATAAARHMAAAGAGVILTLSSSVARMPDAMPGGLMAACTAIEAMSRQLALEVGPRGIRVVCLRPDGIRESARLGSITADVWGRAVERQGMTLDEYLDSPDPRSVLPHTVTLEEVAAVATFMASDRAGGLTATVANVSCGQTPD